MDERQVPERTPHAISIRRMVALACVALAASYAGAFATSLALESLDAAGRLPSGLELEMAPGGPPSPLRHAAAAAGGVLLGLTAVGIVAAIPRRAARRRRWIEVPDGPDPLPLDAPPHPAESLAWLHVTSGPSARRIAHASAELAAGWIARGERVLLIDGGPRLRLHVPLVAEPALGLAECLAGDMPVLGVVQCVGVPGLYVLSHGAAVPPRGWAGLGRLLDEARPHFDRVLLALDLGAPPDVGRALAGRYIEAWWSDARPEQRAGAISLSERIGIRMRGMGLALESQAMLEHLRQRILDLRPAGQPAPEPVPVGGLRPPAAAAPEVRAEPVVLDPDLQVRERLRFLIWMRRLQQEDRAGTAFAPARASALPGTVISG